MSRVGKIPIEIPQGVEVKLEDNLIKVKGSKGELVQEIHPKVNIAIKKNLITVSIEDDSDKKQRSLWGTFRKIIANMVDGVTEGYKKELEMVGVGYKAEVSENKLVLNVGFSHSVEYSIPEEIQINVEKNIIKISGIDKQKVGQVAAEIRSVKKPEPYKGKGIRYVDEIVRKKAGKAAKAVGGGARGA
jgi:large subunit ribosomal protein L6